LLRLGLQAQFLIQGVNPGWSERAVDRFGEAFFEQEFLEFRHRVYLTVRLALFFVLFPVCDSHSQGILPQSCIDCLMIKGASRELGVSATGPRTDELREEKKNSAADSDQGDQRQPWNGGGLFFVFSHVSLAMTLFEATFRRRVLSLVVFIQRE
jgi:hypothetical protein